MSEPDMVVRGVVPVSFHRFYLIDLPEDGPLPFPQYVHIPNGLIVTAQQAIAVITAGIANGDATVDVELHRQAPQLNPAGWDEVVEISMDVPFGHLVVTAVDADLEQPYPELTPQGPGPYRIRVHTRGRDTDIDGSVLEPVEDYLIQVWPSPMAPESIYKQTDAYGASVRLLLDE